MRNSTEACPGLRGCMCCTQVMRCESRALPRLNRCKDVHFGDVCENWRHNRFTLQVTRGRRNSCRDGDVLISSLWTQRKYYSLVHGHRWFVGPRKIFVFFLCVIVCVWWILLRSQLFSLSQHDQHSYLRYLFQRVDQSLML